MRRQSRSTGGAMTGASTVTTMMVNPSGQALTSGCVKGDPSERLMAELHLICSGSQQPHLGVHGLWMPCSGLEAHMRVALRSWAVVRRWTSCSRLKENQRIKDLRLLDGDQAITHGQGPRQLRLR